jgi:hypothetical protein
MAKQSTELRYEEAERVRTKDSKLAVVCAILQRLESEVPQEVVDELVEHRDFPSPVPADVLAKSFFPDNYRINPAVAVQLVYRLTSQYFSTTEINRIAGYHRKRTIQDKKTGKNGREN